MTYVNDDREDMEPIIIALRLERPLSAREAAALSKVAEPETVIKYNKYPNILGKNLSLAGSALMRIAAARTLGVPAAEITIFRGETGKPYVSGGNLFVSLSHSKDLCVCAVCDRPVGVDVEYIKETYPERVAEKYFGEDERALLEGTDGSGKAALFYIMWTRKESLIKCTGEGLSALLKKPDDGFKISSGTVFGKYAVSVCTDCGPAP